LYPRKKWGPVALQIDAAEKVTRREEEKVVKRMATHDGKKRNSDSTEKKKAEITSCGKVVRLSLRRKKEIRNASEKSLLSGRGKEEKNSTIFRGPKREKEKVHAIIRERERPKTY